MSRRSPRGRPRAKPDSPRSIGSPRSLLAAASLIAAAAIVAYFSSFTGAFVFDDEPAIVENTHIRYLTPLSRSMSAPAGTTVSGRPVAALSLAINYALAPEDARDSFASRCLVLQLRTPPGIAATFGAITRSTCSCTSPPLTLFGIVRRTLLSDSLRDRYGTQWTRLRSRDIAAVGGASADDCQRDLRDPARRVADGTCSTC